MKNRVAMMALGHTRMSMNSFMLDRVGEEWDEERRLNRVGIGFGE